MLFVSFPFMTSSVYVHEQMQFGRRVTNRVCHCICSSVSYSIVCQCAPLPPFPLKWSKSLRIIVCTSDTCSHVVQCVFRGSQRAGITTGSDSNSR